uniref:Uncharacterized protein n=1 Tax=Myotis myotis TaxID=51298 RepID=A0A7J7SRL8_MYOMY|nr:hypothetical protein mMyoMyo1_009400 [Myotis myotis]
MRYPVLLSRPMRDTWDPLPSPGSDGGTQRLSSARTAAPPPQGASPRGPGTLTHVWPRDWRLTPADSAFAWGCGALASLLLMPGGGPGGQRRSEDARRRLLPGRRPGVLRGGLAPPKAARPDPRSQSGKVPFAASEARVPRSLTLGGGKNQGLLGSRPTGRAVSHRAGRTGSRSRTPAPPDTAPAPGRARHCPPDGWRAGHPRPEPQRPPGRRRVAAVATARLCQERNFLLRRPLRSPGVARGGSAGRPAGSSSSSSSSRRPVELTRAPAPRARPPLSPPRPDALTEPPRLRGGRRSRAAAPRSESAGPAPAHSSLGSGEAAAAPSAREQRRLGRGGRPGRREGLLGAASGPRSGSLGGGCGRGGASTRRGAASGPWSPPPRAGERRTAGAHTRWAHAGEGPGGGCGHALASLPRLASGRPRAASARCARTLRPPAPPPPAGRAPASRRCGARAPGSSLPPPCGPAREAGRHRRFSETMILALTEVGSHVPIIQPN